MKSNPSQDPLQETFVSRQIRQRKGKVTAISRAKRKSEGKGKRKHPEQGTHNQDLADLRMKMDSARCVILV